jgi:hypothetical protein
VIAVRTRDLVRDRCAPFATFLPQPEGDARSVGTVDHVPRVRAGRHVDVLTAIGTTHRPHCIRARADAGVCRDRSRRRPRLQRG